MNKILLLALLFCLQANVYGQFIIFGNPSQSNITSTGFTVQFTTNTAKTTLIRYGTTPAFELGYLGNGQTTTTHSLNLTGLSPATFYYIRPCVIDGVDTVESTKTAYYSTASNSSGTIKVYFNKSVDTYVSNGTYATITNSPAAIQAELIKRIDSATTTIDCAVYNNNTAAIVTALNNAQTRGVRVRYVYDDGTSNTALTSAAFPTLGINVVDLMHNKFMVIDPNSVNSSYVWTGSMNWTSGNINDDYNNVVLIQDQALAKAYMIEFEEMWGSNTATPNATNSKSGAQKSDNTPHQFIIGGKAVECYFSPSDGTTNKIEAALLSAGGDLEFATLSFTQDELGAAVINRHQSGESVAGIIESIGDLGTEYNTLQSAGVNVWADNHSVDLHHKYGIVDANTPSSDPLVVTGSHNWSSGAEQSNDENTLIIHDANIANWYLQEFSMRYCEVSGTANCHYNPPVAVEIAPNASWTLLVFPNPAKDQLFLRVENADDAAKVRIFNSVGQLMLEEMMSDARLELTTANWAAGTYFVRVETAKGYLVQPIVIVR